EPCRLGITPMGHSVGCAVAHGALAILTEDGFLDDVIVVTETCQSVNDYGWCRLHAFDLADVQLFLVKAKNHFRASFAEHCSQIIDIESPGPSPSDLRTIPFVHVPQSYLT
ncbi:hypothetical protein AA309_30350, partial [Microvirga vignae]